MKTEQVINQVEKELPDKLRLCRYCGGTPEVYVKEDFNYLGKRGYMGKVVCKRCKVSVFAFEATERGASVMTRSYWQRGIIDSN